MVTIPELADAGERWRSSAGSFHPLRVTAVLRQGAPVCAYDPVQLDGLLAWAVVQRATDGAGVANSAEPYEIPLPLACLWRSVDELPMWAATVFRPVGASTPDTVYWHKRAMSGRWTDNSGKRLALKTVAGRWMERRTPVPVRVANEWSATCVGVAEEVRTLLTEVRALGKKRVTGFGQVVEWRVEIMEEAFSLVDAKGRLARPLPIGARSLIEPMEPEGAVTLVGWTPPHWKASILVPGWPTGTPVGAQVDWFGEV